MSATVSGTIIIQIDAFDNEEVSKVELIIDGTNPIVDDSSPYEFTWNTNDASEDNNHFIAATVTDSNLSSTWFSHGDLPVPNRVNQFGQHLVFER